MAKSKEIRAMFVFEMMGRPKEYLASSLEKFTQRIESLNGIKVVNKKLHDPKKIEKEGMKTEMFTAFNEIEIITEDINNIIGITLNFLPSHVEILEPEELIISNNDIGNMLSTIAIKLHRFDEIVKTVTIQRNQVLGKLKQVQEDLDLLKKDEKVTTKKVKKKAKKKTSKKK